MNRFDKQLRRQITFLRNSSWLFDQGCRDEAIRIATCLRVLFSDTGSCVSILRHLNAKNIKLITSLSTSNYDKYPEEVRSFIKQSNVSESFLCALVRIQIGGGKWEFHPILDDFDPDQSCVLPFDEWWSQTVWSSMEHKLSRKELVCSAADKDGGAHVDKKLNEEYDDYITGGHLQITVKSKGVIKKASAEDIHLFALRTMGNEVLKSPDILGMLTSSKRD
jgi:hypothetical protein